MSGSLPLALPVALVAGLVSCFSPCVLPLLPGYLSYTTGLSGVDLADARRGRMVLGGWLWTYQRQITLVLGAFTILVGLTFVGVVPWFQRDLRVHRVPAVGLAAAPLLGVFAWVRRHQVWAFITWVVYAAYLHARATAGWRGRAASVIALIGFATLLFNFVGINYFFGSGSMHSYAG